MTHIEGRVEWDPGKARKNFAKHGVTFEDAMEIFSGAEILLGTRTGEDGEVRHLAVGFVSGLLLLVVVFTDRNGRIRIISARPASRQERKLYHERITR